MDLTNDFSIASLLIHADTLDEDEIPVGVPISTSTTFRHAHPRSRAAKAQQPATDEGVAETIDVEGGPPFNAMNPERHVYSRYTQPTLSRVEKVLSALLKGHALALSSGLSAVFCALLHYQPEVIAITKGYHGSHETINLYARTRPDVRIIDLDDDYMQYQGKRLLCWLETPVNPEGICRDIAKYVAKTRAVKDAHIAVDATFGPPPLQDPFEFGVDLVMHSGTKYFAGHSDALIGVLATKDASTWNRLWTIRTYAGMTPGSLETWLLLRSLRTVSLRVPRQASTATAFALWLNEIATKAPEPGSSHDGCPGGFVAKVTHAALQAKETGFNPLAPSEGQKKAQMSDGPACFSFLTTKKEFADLIPHNLKMMVPATSLGGVESLAEQRSLSDASAHPCQIRLSIGLEDLEDLKEDFRRGVKAVLEQTKRFSKNGYSADMSKLRNRTWEDAPSGSRGIEIGDWRIETRKRPILNAAEIEEWARIRIQHVRYQASERLSIPLPEITFGNNLVSLRLVRGQEEWNLKFDALDALSLVDTTGEEGVKVSYAAQWAKSRNLSGGNGSREGQSQSMNNNGESPTPDATPSGDFNSSNIIETVKNFDWTYSTTYAGSSTASSSGGLSATWEEARSEHAGIPLSKLARTDEPILFYDDVTLFEDELHDNGIANLSVKLRVMPSSFFLLSRFFLRVDNVLFRIFDVRIYHDLASNEIVRETKGKEASYSEVRKRLPRERPDDLTPLTDANWVANVLGMLETENPGGQTSTSASKMQPTIGSAGTTPAPWAIGSASTSAKPPMASRSDSNSWDPSSSSSLFASSDRRQVAPGVSIPIRSPSSMGGIASGFAGAGGATYGAASSPSPTPSVGAGAGVAVSSYSTGLDKMAADGAGSAAETQDRRKPWKGVGRKLSLVYI